MSNVFKKYNGKPESEAVKFAMDIKKDFDTDKIFTTLIRRLKQLKTKACHEDDKALIEEIVAFINDIEVKNKAWNAKGQMALLSGIQHRMKC